MENVATYSEARSEYTKQLAIFIVPSIVAWFQTLWTRNASDRQRCLSAFQSECEEIARWNQDRINDEVRALLERSGCDYMEELMTAVFVAHTKVLTAVRLSTKQKKLSITVPKLDHFIHRVFKESARCFWKTPFLFMSDGGVVERQKNILQIEALASESITTAIRGLLPVKQILKDYLGDDEEEVTDEPEVKPAEAPAVKSEVKSEVKSVDQPEKPDEVKLEVKEVLPEESREKSEDKEIKAAEVKTEEKQEPAPVPVVQAPSIIKIDTEPAVHFSDYDAVFDETKGAPEMLFNPKDGEDDDGPSSDALTIHEGPYTPLTADDAEDLDASALPPKKDVIDDSEVVVLE
jgi:hypothetical protein